MAPPVTVTALLIVLALVPGWIYLRHVQRLRLRSLGSAPHQLLEVLAVGVITTGLSAFVVALLPHRFLPFALDVGAWVSRGSTYPVVHWRSAATSVALVFVLACLIACLLYWVRKQQVPAEFEGHGNLWVTSLGTRPPGKAPWVTLHLEDGRVVEGQLHSFSLDQDPEKREMCLARPLRITEDKATEAQWLPNLDRLVVSADKIAFITVIHVPAQATVGRGSSRFRVPMPRR